MRKNRMKNRVANQPLEQFIDSRIQRTAPLEADNATPEQGSKGPENCPRVPLGAPSERETGDTEPNM